MIGRVERTAKARGWNANIPNIGALFIDPLLAGAVRGETHRRKSMFPQDTASNFTGAEHSAGKIPRKKRRETTIPLPV